MPIGATEVKQLPDELGSISLSQKVHPSDFLAPEHRDGIVGMSMLDNDMADAMAPLVKRVAALPASAWTREGQAENVTIMRPYHDNLGIFNIPFIFCDDAVRNVYHFPWYHDWRKELEPIFRKLNINPAQLLRCVMARLPAGVTIPVHHDTGRWVQVAHRIHCPVITNSQVFFYAGHSVDQMHKYQLPVGCAVELNNAAKHKVENLGPSDRVHLMMDYADAPPGGLSPFPRVIQLQTTDAFVQTRRTLRLKRFFKPPVRRTSSEFPACVIIGAMKAGTSSLFDYLQQHPQIEGAIMKETHFFDWNWRKRYSKSAGSGDANEAGIEFFANAFEAKAYRARPATKTAKKPVNKLEKYARLFNCANLMRDQNAVCVEVWFLTRHCARTLCPVTLAMAVCSDA